MDVLPILEIFMKLKEQIHAQFKLLGYSSNAELTYWHWIEQFLRYSARKNGNWIHPKEMAEADVEAFLTHLAINRHSSPTTQNVSIQAILLL